MMILPSQRSLWGLSTSSEQHACTKQGQNHTVSRELTGVGESEISTEATTWMVIAGESSHCEHDRPARDDHGAHPEDCPDEEPGEEQSRQNTLEHNHNKDEPTRSIIANKDG